MFSFPDQASDFCICITSKYQRMVETHRRNAFSPIELLEALAPLQNGIWIATCSSVSGCVHQPGAAQGYRCAADGCRQRSQAGGARHAQPPARRWIYRCRFLSVREVLKRLCSQVVVLNSDKGYSLHPQAEAVLTGKMGLRCWFWRITP